MRLPRLADGPGTGLPRVYDLALELISHLDGQIAQDHLHKFVALPKRFPAYAGRTWAVPAMLRLAGIENLRRTASRIAWPWLAEHSHEHRAGGQAVADLNARNQTADELSMRASVLSLRTLAALDWKEFVEGQSAVEHILRRDPAGVYGRMDFGSRDCYRREVEKLARHSPLSEQEVAQRVLDFAQRGGCADAGPDCSATPRQQVLRHHVGYYLIDRGRAAIEESIGYRAAWTGRLVRVASPRRWPAIWGRSCSLGYSSLRQRQESHGGWAALSSSVLSAACS